MLNFPGPFKRPIVHEILASSTQHAQNKFVQNQIPEYITLVNDELLLLATSKLKLTTDPF
jgi:hypothetical protein